MCWRNPSGESCDNLFKRMDTMINTWIRQTYGIWNHFMIAFRRPKIAMKKVSVCLGWRKNWAKIVYERRRKILWAEKSIPIFMESWLSPIT